jgi:hypothetical protein
LSGACLTNSQNLRPMSYPSERLLGLKQAKSVGSGTLSETFQ